MEIKVYKVLRHIGSYKRFFVNLVYVSTCLLLIGGSYSWFEKNRLNAILARRGRLSKLDNRTKLNAYEKFQERIQLPQNTSYKKNSPQHHVVFLKVHKAASSTMQNILLRYAMQNKLNVLFHKYGPHINERGTKIVKKYIVEHPPGMKFDILCNHIIFNYDEISPYFPKDTVYVGIVREPFHQFRSAFKYYSVVWPRRYLLNIRQAYPQYPMHEHLKNPLRFEPTRPNHSDTNNRMSVDFGFPLDNFEESKRDGKKIQEFLTFLDNTFHLVLIADMFDESMVLFKRVMNWDIKDILYMKNNQFSGNPHFNTSYTEQDYNQFRKWATLDYALYNHFLEIFKTKIRSEPGFEEEVCAFRKIRTHVAELCEEINKRKINSPLLIGGNRWTDGIYVSSLLCQQMAMDELHLVSLAKQEQQNRMKDSLK